MTEHNQYLGNLTSEHVEDRIREALKGGFGIVYSSPRTILLDLDDDESVTRYDKQIDMLAEHYGLYELESWKSKSGNKHVVLTLEAPIPDPKDRIILQLVLGSDPVREFLSLEQINNGVSQDKMSMLFKPGRKRSCLKR